MKSAMQLLFVMTLFLSQLAQAQLTAISSLSNKITCFEKSCQFKPTNIPSTGLDEMVKKVSYDVFSNEYSDNSLMISPERDSILFQHSNPQIMLSIAQALIARDVRPQLSQVENSEVTLRFKVVRIDLSKRNEFGYDFSGLFGGGIGTGKKDEVSVGGQGIGAVFSPISSALLNFSIHHAKENGAVSEGDDIVKSYSNYEDIDLTQNQNRYRSDSAYDSVSESIGWRVSGKVIIGENGMVRVNNLNVRYGVPTDATVATNSSNTLVESINFSNQVVELPLGYSKVLFTREVNFSQNSKKSGMWILSKENLRESRRYKIFFVLEAGNSSSFDELTSLQLPKLSAAEIAQLPAPTTTSANQFLNSLAVQLPTSNQVYVSPRSINLKWDKSFLDQALATQVVSRSIKQVRSKDWVEKQKVFTGQDLINDMNVNLISSSESCNLNQECEVTKFLLRVGLDNRVYGEVARTKEAYYQITFVPNANYVDAKIITAEDARKLDKDFVRQHNSNGR